MIFSPFSIYCLSCHHSDARPINLEVTCLRMSSWLYLLNNGCTNFSVSHIQSLNDIGPISSPKNGMSLWNVWCNSWLPCLCNLGLYVEYVLMVIEWTYATWTKCGRGNQSQVDLQVTRGESLRLLKYQGQSLPRYTCKRCQRSHNCLSAK